MEDLKLGFDPSDGSGRWEFRTTSSKLESDTICWSFGYYVQENEKVQRCTWLIASSSFLEVIYRPRREGLPFYTNRNRSVCRNIASCGGRLRGSEVDDSDYFLDADEPDGKDTEMITGSVGRQKEIYGRNDILKFEKVDDVDIGQSNINAKIDSTSANISLVTKWKGIRVHLRSHRRGYTQNNPKSRIGLKNAVIENSLNAAIYKGSQECEVGDKSNQEGIELLTPHTSTTPLLKSNPAEGYKDPGDHSSDTGMDCIVITFALPSVQDETCFTSQADSITPPPLIWKVDFPLDPRISLEHLTVLNGDLSYSERKPPIKHPSHIYINGWQSWSFSGSVARGDPQPGSAMPDYLSRAFNFGGSCPNRISPKRTRIRTSSTSNETSSLAPSGDAVTPPSYYKSEMYTALTYNEFFQTFKEDHMLDANNTSSIILGWISQRKQFGMIGVDESLSKVAMHCSCDGIVSNVQIPLPTDQFKYKVSIDSRHKSYPFLQRERLQTDWAWCQIIHKNSQPIAPPPYSLANLGSSMIQFEPLSFYIDFVAQYNQARHHLREPLSTGWCSWYHYYENLDESTLIENFETLQQLNARGVGFNMCMCDDGYMSAWGDWDSIKPPNKFPSQHNAMKKISNGMADRSMRPGVWLAPFAADKHSVIAQQHPEWIIRNHAGVAANSANCGKFFYGLDATNPAVLEHARRSIERAVKEWGYKVLKLDFLYSSCLEGNGKFDLSMTRAEAMNIALKTVRDAAGDDVFIIGCGCPVGSAIGYVDGMRVSADTGPKWDPSFPLPWWDNGTLPCVRNMIRNSLNRVHLSHRWWHNDPDCLLLGKTTSLTDEEIVSAASIIAMSGGMLLLSDDLPALTPDRFEIATKLFPICEGVAMPLDLHCSYGSTPSLLQLWCTDESHAISPQMPTSLHSSGKNRSRIIVSSGLGTWTIVSLSNWLEVDAVVSAPFSALMLPHTDLPSGNRFGFHVFAFWGSKYAWVPCHESLDAGEVQRTLSKRLGPHETELFHVKQVTPGSVQYIGSTLHYTCGYEIEKLSLDDTSATFYLKEGKIRSAAIYVFVPGDLQKKLHATFEGIHVSTDVVQRLNLGESDSTGTIALGAVIRIKILPSQTSNNSICSAGKGNLTIYF